MLVIFFYLSKMGQPSVVLKRYLILKELVAFNQILETYTLFDSITHILEDQAQFVILYNKTNSPFR